jgi:hypothetical protein
MRRQKNLTGLTYRELEKRATACGHSLPRSTLTSVLSRSSLPRERVITAFVLACGGNADDVQEWLAVRRRLSAGGPMAEDVAPRRRQRVPVMAMPVFGMALSVGVAVVVALSISPVSENVRTTAGGTINTVAVEDTYVAQHDKVGTHGRNSELRACGGRCDPGGADKESRILLKYRVDELPEGACVRSAVLRMWTKTDNDPASVFAVRVVDAKVWDESTASWGTQPSGGEVLATRHGGQGGQWMNFDVTSSIRTAGVYSFIVHSTGEQGGHFAAKEDAALNHPPELVLNHTRC